MKLNYIDIHSHLNLKPLYEKREHILQHMQTDGIGTITVGTGIETSRTAVEIAEQNPGLCWATVGIHPCDCSDAHIPTNDFDNEWQELVTLAQHSSVVAIGETGLDYFHDDTPEMRLAQTDIFKKHIELAIQVNKPLMLHVRSSRGSDDAYYDALKILQQEHYTGRANFHFFSGSKQCMLDIVATGYTVSVDGPITFVGEYDEMIVACPLEKIMIETDAPYAAPVPYRGKTCEPWMVVHVAERIAELKNLPLETVRLQLLENTKEFFGIEIE